MTALTAAYRVLASIALPFAARRTVAKLRQGGIDVHRTHERLGHATLERGLGDLIWIHAASVGESKSALILIERLLAMAPTAQILVTTGTASSAKVLAPRLPSRAFHQFAPLDGRGPIKRFLRHWRPQIGIFIESEIWPNLINCAHDQGVPLALLNARLSEGSARNWSRAPKTARDIFGLFGIIHTQDTRTARALGALGLTHARIGVNLKSVLLPPRINELARARLEKQFGPRPLWAAVSTHPGEDEIMIKAHHQLRQSHPNAALILVPRHPERARGIRLLCEGHSIAQRSLEEMPDTETSIYLADTLGETDLWFNLADLVCLCGSFSDVGGHTPFEPAAAGAAILHGPHYSNFEEVYAKFSEAGASLQVHDAETLAESLDLLIRQPDHARALGENARPLAKAGLEELDRLAAQCLTLAGIERN
ncbi:MAG: 3-deoxy-D-manno-octulosonic acid transferase [Paracoccaceae bacterium]